MLDRDTASLPAHSSHANDRFADVIVTSLVVSVLTSHGGRGRDSGRLGVYRLSVGVSGGICHRHWLQRQRQQRRRRRRRPRRWRVQVSTCRAVCPSLPPALARSSNDRPHVKRLLVTSHVRRKNVSTQLNEHLYGRIGSTATELLRTSSVHAVASFRGAGGSADPPPRSVKCKSFALSVSSKGSLYISHNGR